MSRHLDTSTTTQMAYVMVQYGRPSRSSWTKKLYGHPLAGLLWERQFEKILLETGWEKVPTWECLFEHREKGLLWSVYVDDIKLDGKKERTHQSDVESTPLRGRIGRTQIILDHVYLGRTQRHCETRKRVVDNDRTIFESRISAGAVEKLLLQRCEVVWLSDYGNFDLWVVVNEKEPDQKWIIITQTSHSTAYLCKSIFPSDVISKLHEWMNTFQMKPKVICADMAVHHPQDTQAFFLTHNVKGLPTNPHTPWPHRDEMGVRSFRNFSQHSWMQPPKNLDQTRKAATVRNKGVTASGKTPMQLAMGKKPRNFQNPTSMNPEQVTPTPTKQDLLNK